MNDYNLSDVAFVQMMIPHHQAAVSAAASAYLYAKNPQIKEMAGAILTGQQAEIEKFRQWLKDRGIAEKAPSKAGGM